MIDWILREICESQTSIISVPDLALVDRTIYCTRIKNSKWLPQNTHNKGNLIFYSYSKRMWGLPVSNCNPRLPKTWQRNTSMATFKGHKKSRIRPKSKMFGVRCTLKNNYMHTNEIHLWELAVVNCALWPFINCLQIGLELSVKGERTLHLGQCTEWHV